MYIEIKLNHVISEGITFVIREGVNIISELLIIIASL